MAAILERARHSAFLWMIRRRLLSLEKRISDSIGELKDGKLLTDPLDSQLHLALKSAVSAHACLLLLKDNLRQEADVSQRVFLEAWVHLMYFTWFPGSQAFSRWRARPGKPLDGKRFPLKQDVERELPKRLNLSIAQKFPVGELFGVFSNLSVHPTRYAAERCWREIATRRRIGGVRSDLGKIHSALGRILAIAKTAVFLVQLHLFLQFLRVYLLREPLVLSCID